MNDNTGRRAQTWLRPKPRQGRAKRLATGLVLGAVFAACSTPAPTPIASGLRSVVPRGSPSAPSPSGSAPDATPTTLLKLSGSGDKESTPFTASGDRASLVYSFDCTSHSAGHFGLSFYDLTGLSLDTVNYTLAITGTSDQDSQTIYISNTAAPYHLAIISDCDWSVTVTGMP
jgi:hypothetical protein